MKVAYIDIGKEHSMWPGPRYKRDGPGSAEEFRERLLIPAFDSSDMVVVNLDSPHGFAASFIEEAFGGLVRKYGLRKVDEKLRIDAVKRAYLIPLIRREMEQAEQDRQRGGAR